MSDTFDHEAEAWDARCFHEDRYYDEDNPDYISPNSPRRWGRRLRVNKHTTPARLEVHIVLRCKPEQVVVVAQTGKALLLSAEGTDSQAWFPLSQMEGDGEPGTQTVPTWLGVRILEALGHL